MRVLRVLKDGELALTHLFSPSQPIPRTFHHPHLLRNSTTQHRTVPFALFRMASTLPRRPEWTASQVRETFLDYFKKNGHTFGTPNFAPPLLCSFFFALLLADMRHRYSAFIFGGPSIGPYSALHKCWYEPVQVDFPRNCRSPVRLCAAQACRQLSEGTPRPLSPWILYFSC